MGRPSRRGSRTVLAVGAVAGMLYAWFASAPRPFTVAANVAVFVPALALAACAVAQARHAHALPAALRRRPGPPVGTVTLVRRAVPWFLTGLAIVAMELVELFQGPRSAHPTVSSLIDPTLAHHPARFAYFVAWLAFGAFLVTR